MSTTRGFASGMAVYETYDESVKTVDKPFGQALTFSPDGTQLAMLSGGPGRQPSLILVYDATTGRECARWDGPAGPRPSRS